MTKKDEILEQLQDLVPRAVVMFDGLENIEHRIGVIIEGQRQQLGHLVGDLRIREMQSEMNQIKNLLQGIYTELKAKP